VRPAGAVGRRLSDRQSAIAGWLASALLAAAVVLPLVGAPGIPLFVHDWIWSPYAARTVWTAHFLYSAWVQTGLGEPNSAISVNPLAWTKVVLATFLSGRASLLLYLYGSLVFAFAGVFRLARRNLGLAGPWALASVCFFAATPFVFNKIASGQSSYWAGAAAFVWGTGFCLDAFESGHVRDAARAAACFALASLQLQMLAFAVLTFGLAAVAYRTRRALAFAAAGSIASAVLAFPSVWFLALRGPEAGANISPPYQYWIAAQSSRPFDAIAMLGYSVLYVERALNDLGGAALPAVEVAGVVALFLALCGVALERNRQAFVLGGMAAAGYVIVTGTYGPAAPLWSFAFAHFEMANFLRELYHAEMLYALPVSLLAASALAWCARRVAWPPAIGAAVLAACLGLATWGAGFARVLPFTATPPYRERLAAAIDGDESRVLFLPAQQPLATPGDAVGGNDGLDWVDAWHHSMYEYYLPPLVAYVEAALYRGDAAAARRILPRLACSAVVYRAGIASLGYEAILGGPDRSLAALSAAFGAPLEVAPGVDVFTLPARRLLDTAARVAAAPPDLRRMTDASAAYLDVPGRDPARYAIDLYAQKPDPGKGWIRRRDAAVANAAELAVPAYGIVTNEPGAAVRLEGVPPGSVLFWGPSGIAFDADAARAARPARLRSVARNVTITSRGPAAILEVGEAPLDPMGAPLGGRATITEWAHPAPWAYRARVALHGRTALVLRERYDEAWQVEGDGVAIERHVRADGFANAWILSGTGIHELRFYYAAQKETFVLLGASLLLFVLLLVRAAAPAPLVKVVRFG